MREPGQLPPLSGVLCVDLDGTLISGDVSFESLLMFLKQNPINILPAIVWLMRGRAYFKRQIALRVRIDPSTLPYREDFLAYLRKRKQAGCRLILVTASDQIYADAIQNETRLFAEVHGSDGFTNLSGRRKGEFIAAHHPGCGYAGNSRADLAVWKMCGEAIAVGASDAVIRKLKTITIPSEVFPADRLRIPDLLQLLRVHQWAKNLIIFFPLIAAHKIFQIEDVIKAAFAFAAFSLMASAVYILNDLMDIEADRAHPKKRLRPGASGRISIPHAFLAAFALAAASVVLALGADPPLIAVLAGYFALTSAYTLFLKKIAIVDVLSLAILYTVRLIAGHAAAGIAFSPWLLTFSMFIFFSLALVKRYSELYELPASGPVEVKGRGYIRDDLWIVSMLGVGSGLISVLVMALYVTSDTVQTLYVRPYVLLMLCPVLLFWIARVWMLAHRGLLDDDPVFFALKDPASYLSAAACALIMLLAAFL